MLINFRNRDYDFVPWRPRLGQVFSGPFSFDSETTLLDDQHPWITPAFVIGAAFDGVRGFFVTRAHLADFLEAHPDNVVVLHNASFDLDVIAKAVVNVDHYDRVDRDMISDTQIMHRLLVLAQKGDTADGKGESTLEYCTAVYLGAELPKDTVDSHGKPVRLSYGQWLNRPQDIELVYLDYLAKDVVATFQVYQEITARTEQLLSSSTNVWGCVPGDWLRECQVRFGLLTHNIQLKAAIVLREITSNGLHLDATRRDSLKVNLNELLNVQKSGLRAFNYLPGGKGTNKSLQAVLSIRARRNNRLNYPRTESGQFATAHDAIQHLVDEDPFIKALLEYRETEKLLGSFLGKMAKPVLHPSFNVLARTGRTTSFGDINAQNLPKSDAVRACFVPSPGHEFIDADYATIELATLAQACVGQFGLTSEMGRAINYGADLHRLVAARMFNKPGEQVTKAERQKAKAVNFGKPGGMGNAALTSYAKVNYAVDLTEVEAEALSESWFGLFPEMREFLADQSDTAAEIAELLNLTPTSHYESTSDARFFRHPDNAGRQNSPHPILGAMLLKVVKADNPITGNGKPYSAPDIEYFWSRLDAVIGRLPKSDQNAVRNRKPSSKIQRSVMGLVGRAPVFTLTGRLRANATYTARHNTVFQGLAADGAKLALWKLWRADYRIVNFIHDQVLIEIPKCSPADRMRHARSIREHMIAGMQEVVPDVRIDVSFAASDRWYKDAELKYGDSEQELLLWTPPQCQLLTPNK